MRGQTVVLDSSNLSAVIADATGEPLATDKPKEEAKPAEVKADEKADAKADEAKGETVKAEAEDPDDIEGEDGLTPRHKRDLTEKMQRAIGKKHRALKEAEEFAAEQYNEKRLAEQRAEQYEREINRLKAQGAQAEPVKTDEGRPVRENFKTDEEFRDATDDWRVDQKFKAREAEAAKAKEADRQKQILADATVRLNKAKELVPDFEETISAADVEVPPYIAGYMQESEMLAELGYHFAKNPGELDKLRSLSPAKALVAIGKIESMLKPFVASADDARAETVKEEKVNGEKPKTAQEPSKEKPRVAAPITPLNGGSGAQVEKGPREMTYAEAKLDYERRNKIKLGKRQRH